MTSEELHSRTDACLVENALVGDDGKKRKRRKRRKYRGDIQRVTDLHSKEENHNHEIGGKQPTQQALTTVKRMLHC